MIRELVGAPHQLRAPPPVQKREKPDTKNKWKEHSGKPVRVRGTPDDQSQQSLLVKGTVWILLSGLFHAVIQINSHCTSTSPVK